MSEERKRTCSPFECTAVALRPTIEESVGKVQAALGLVTTGYDHLSTALVMLKEAFPGERYGTCSHYFTMIPPHPPLEPADCKAETLTKVKQLCWRRIVALAEMKKTLSEKRCLELDGQLDRAESLPEFTLPNVLAFIEHWSVNIEKYQQEMVAEVYKLLTHAAEQGRKSICRFEVGKRTIIDWMVEGPENWSKHKWSIRYEKGVKLRNLQTLFQLFDGQGLPSTYYGELYDAIQDADMDGKGETRYFIFKCHRNRSLHITFRRQDLVDKLNLEMSKYERSLKGGQAA